MKNIEKDEYTKYNVTVNYLPLDSFQLQPDTYDNCRQLTVARDSRTVESPHQLRHMPTHTCNGMLWSSEHCAEFMFKITQYKKSILKFAS